MSAPAPAPTSHHAPVGPDTLISIKLIYDGCNRRFKLPLRELGAYSLPQKIRAVLAIPDNTDTTLERYSDSAGSYIVLDSENPSVYKQLHRAAKAKLKLRIKVTTAVPEPPPGYYEPAEPPVQNTQPQHDQSQPRCSYLDTVLRDPANDYGQFLTTSHFMAPQPAVLNASMFPNVPEDTPVENKSVPVAAPQELPNENPNPTLPPLACLSGPMPSICIDCNYCGRSVPDAHYHCSICDDGDYDLCQRCIDQGILCPGEGHWLIKRTIQGGVVTNSITETIAPRKRVEQEEPVEETQVEEDETKFEERTCNACFRDFNENELVTCKDCPDYDLCFTCLREDRHGHHPKHTFAIIADHEEFESKSLVAAACAPGRGRRHAAICDGCNKSIRGVRHKCLNCPDWDYCSECIDRADAFHPGHRFAPIYEPLPEPHAYHQTHYGVICDGPLCCVSPKVAYIRGVRYKCAVCHDTDFCANCEAHPDNTHNRTHPLIKFKTPVRHTTVSTVNVLGSNVVQMGDRPATKSTSTETVAPSNSNAATQVHAEADNVSEADSTSAQPSVKEAVTTTSGEPETSSPKLHALFVRDTITDGSQLRPDQIITQTWTLFNPGPGAWPKGCSVQFVGGDSMFNVDNNHPYSTECLNSAMETQRLSAPVEPTDSAEFTVTLKTPQRIGRAISYWRLKTPEGLPFGHKLWCDIEVQDQPFPPTTPVDNRQPTVETEASSVESQTEAGDAGSERETSRSGSTMIFPKLETESPASASKHESNSPTVIVTDENTEQHDLADDVESLTLDGPSTDEDFLTDEEYDILDASDQEFIPEPQKQK
ncbi:hypothetical protein FQN53_004940 [Emmonsiellopsis sp. PD_33]|nr:hypothetical protein FQN53_004940 [Emmonsiellopsis sp. PD_33]